MSKGVHNIAFYVSPDPECSRTTQNSEISLAPSRGHILYAIYGNSTCVINHIVVTAIDKRYRNYYISTGFADIARPLNQLTKKEQVWEWTDRQQRAFDALRMRVMEEPVLSQPKLDKPFELEVDASGFALGAVLLQ